MRWRGRRAASGADEHGGPARGTTPPCPVPPGAATRSPTPPTVRPVSDAGLLFREFLRAPTRVATLTASSDALVAAMLAPLGEVVGTAGGDPVVVELGPGTGRVTGAVAERLAGRGRHLAVELNPRLAGPLAAHHPGVTVVRGDAGDLPALLRAHGVERVDMISSLLPWTAWAGAPIARVAASVLAPGGVLTQVSLLPFAWMPPARRQLRELRAAFGDVVVGGPVWANLPAARVLTARRPRL